MRRAPIVLAATAAGLAGTLGFHARPSTATSATTADVAASTSSASSASTASPPSSSSKTTAASTSSAKTATGSAVSTIYGNVQLKVTVSNGKITNIEPVQLPSSDPRSVEINNYAAPLLKQSALSKQDGTVDAVSGATYTSTGYQTALQSALDKAGYSAA